MNRLNIFKSNMKEFKKEIFYFYYYRSSRRQHISIVFGCEKMINKKSYTHLWIPVHAKTQSDLKNSGREYFESHEQHTLLINSQDLRGGCCGG